MTKSERAAAVVSGLAVDLRSVPSADHPFVCQYCLGPTKLPYPMCWRCKTYAESAPPELTGRIVPLTSVVNPSPWYWRLQNYKHSYPNEGLKLAAVLHVAIEDHGEKIEGMLGGPWDVVTVVPSSNPERTFLRQPLKHVVGRSSLLLEKLAPLLARNHSIQVERGAYRPDAFPVTENAHTGKRILLVEDLWATGCKAVSAAGSLLENGAEAVVILPIARLVDFHYWTAAHPYLQEMTAGYDRSRWPRS